jgi:predicted GTPase
MNINILKKYKHLIFIIPLIFYIQSCAHKEENKKEFEVDQEIIDGYGNVNFARAHYIVAQTDSMNNMLENTMLKHIREYCEEKKLKQKVLRHYLTQTDFVTLKYDYRKNREVKVYEFQCTP